MNAPDIAKLRADLRDAESAAALAVAGVNDGGSANLDSAFLNVGAGHAFKRKCKALDDIFGYSARVQTAWWRGYMLRVGSGYGQGARRTIGVEAAVKLLKERGWDVSTFYRVD